MLSDFKFIQTDERNKYKTKLRSSRLNSQSVPKLIDSINIVDNSTKSYVVRNVEQFDTLKEEFGNEFRDGHVCYMLGSDGADHLIYVWSEADNEWMTISLSGTVDLHGYRKTSDKINLETEVTGKLPIENIDDSIITEKDIDKDVIGKLTEKDNKLEYDGKPIGGSGDFDDSIFNERIALIESELKKKISIATTSDEPLDIKKGNMWYEVI